MSQNLRPLAIIATVALVVGVLENTFFGADSGGAKHDISVGFFLLSVLAALSLVVIGITALVRRNGATRA